jgi:uncharacterized membrane protein HdeD (DUF308 family)
MGRIYLFVALCAVIGVAHITNGVQDIVQDSNAAGLHPTFWLASGTFLLALGVMTGVNRNKWKLEHTLIRYLCTFLCVYFSVAQGQSSSSRSDSG